LKPLKYDPAARKDIKAAHAWYSRQSAQASDDFYEELLPAIERVHRKPRQHTPYLYGAMRFVLNQFPFSIVYRELLQEIQIIAVAHAKRRPGYWASRL
jgi:plasmid stabilization system protein ParE